MFAVALFLSVLSAGCGHTPVGAGGHGDDGPSEDFRNAEHSADEATFCGVLEGRVPGFADDTGKWDIGVSVTSLSHGGSKEDCPAAMRYFTQFFSASTRLPRDFTSGRADREDYAFNGGKCALTPGLSAREFIRCFVQTNPTTMVDKYEAFVHGPRAVPPPTTSSPVQPNTGAPPPGVSACGEVKLPNEGAADVFFVKASEGGSAQWNCEYAKRTAVEAFTRSTQQGGAAVTVDDVQCHSGPDQYGPFAAASYFFTCADPMGSGLALRRS